LLIGLIGLGACTPGTFFSNTVDASKLNAEISQKALQEGSTITASCPSGEPAKADYKFVCSATVNGQSEHILVTVLNGNGDVSWVATP
jgi:hypothetical protein